MASLVSHFGPNAISDGVGPGQRVVLVTPRGVRRFGHGWSESSKGIWASNLCWVGRATTSSYLRSKPQTRQLSFAEREDRVSRRMVRL